MLRVLSEAKLRFSVIKNRNERIFSCHCLALMVYNVWLSLETFLSCSYFVTSSYIYFMECLILYKLFSERYSYKSF